MNSTSMWRRAFQHHHFHKHHHRHHGRLPYSFWIIIRDIAVFLPPNQETFAVNNLHEDQILNYAIAETDAKGNPIVPVQSDAAPVWSSSNPAAGTLTASTDGLSAVLTPADNAVGQVTTVSMTLVANGVSFTATDDVTIIAGAVATVAIVGTQAPAPAAPAPAPAP